MIFMIQEPTDAPGDVLTNTNAEAMASSQARSDMPVPYWTRTDFTVADEVLLAGSGISIVHVRDERLFIALAIEAGLAVMHVHGPASARNEAANLAHRLVAEYVFVIAVVDAGDVISLRQASGFANSVAASDFPRDLQRIILDARNEAWRRRMFRLVEQLDSPALRGALRELLRIRLANRPADEQPPPHTVTDLAMRAGVSRSHLSAKAKASGVPLREFVRECLAITAAHDRHAHQVSWDALSWKAGYKSLAGLSELSRSVFGVPLRDVSIALVRDHQHRLVSQLQSAVELSE